MSCLCVLCSASTVFGSSSRNTAVKFELPCRFLGRGPLDIHGNYAIFQKVCFTILDEGVAHLEFFDIFHFSSESILHTDDWIYFINS